MITKESAGGAADPRHVLVVAVVVAKVPEQCVAAGDALHADPRPVVTVIRDGVFLTRGDSLLVTFSVLCTLSSCS